jgi:hypothetical protein
MYMSRKCSVPFLARTIYGSFSAYETLEMPFCRVIFLITIEPTSRVVLI